MTKRYLITGLPINISLGLLSIGLGFVLLIFHPHELAFKMLMTMSEKGILFGIWKEPDADILVRAYAFNITNPRAFLRQGEKLKLQEVGPYIYKETIVQKNPKFNHNIGIVTTNPRYTVEWLPHLNTRRENDTFMFPNIATLLLGNKVAKEYPALLMPLNMLISQTRNYPIKRQTWRAFMFGEENALVTLGHIFLPGWIGFKKLGILDRFYDQKGDVATTFTGETDMHLSGLFETYNNLPNLPHWKYPCDKLQGSTNALKFGNKLQPTATALVYRKGLCRTLPFTPVGPSDSSPWGIPTTLYKLEENAFDNGARNPKNSCYCRRGRCLVSGLSDMTNCYYNVSIALSAPHFFKGDPSLLRAVDGLKPDHQLHDSFLHINQETGIVTSAAVRMQINIVLDNMHNVFRSDKFSNTVVPVAWFEIGISELPFLYRAELFLLLLFPLAETITACILLTVGCGFILRIIQELIRKTYSCSSHLEEEEPKSETGDNKTQKQTDWEKDNPRLIFCVSDLRSLIRSVESLQSQEESLTAV